MATKIASLYAEIGGDTTKLDKSLKNTESGLKGFAGKLNDTVKNLTGFSLGSLTAAGALMQVGKFIMDATRETQTYNLAMADMALKMGTSTEEASRLVQVADDVRVTQEQLSTAMTYAIRNGIEPSIDGMASLADEYISLKDPVERGQLLLKNFGRSGMEMGKLLELGGDGIRMASEGIADSLVVTKEAAEESKKYYAAVDNLNDAWTGFKMNVGNTVIPIITDLIDGKGELITQMQDEIDRLGTGAGLWTGYGMAAEEVDGKIKILTESLRWTAQAQHAVGEETGFAADEADNQFNGFTRLTSAMIYHKAVAILDADAALALGISMGIVDEEAIIAEKVLNALALSQQSGALTASQYADAVGRLNGMIGSLQGKEIDIIVNIITNGKMPAGASFTEYNYNTGGGRVDLGLNDDGTTKRGHATGASFTVPAGYNDNYPILAKTGEQVDIKPAGQPQAGIEELIVAIRSMPSQISRAVRDAVLTA